MQSEERVTTVSLVLAERQPLTLNGLRQLFLYDPNGIKIEINIPG